MAEGSVDNRIALALVGALYAKGLLTQEEIVAAADQAEDGSEDGAEAAHLLRCALLGLDAPSPTDWRADQARKRLRIVPSDGGSGG